MVQDEGEPHIHKTTEENLKTGDFTENSVKLSNNIFEEY